MSPTEKESRLRWLALYVACGGAMMAAVDETIVGVALPTIKHDLLFSQASLSWVVNAYMITFGGFVLLAGRLSDIFSARRFYRIGIALFVITSLGCGLANSQGLLVLFRFVQGIAGAVLFAVVLSLVVTLFPIPKERAKAMGVYGLLLACGGSTGVLLGGAVTTILSWHAIFLINLPIGIILFVLSLRLLPTKGGQTGTREPVDFGGAITITTSMMLATYAIVNGDTNGWGSSLTLGAFGAAVLLFCLFLLIETRSKVPLLPLSIFRTINVSAVSVLRVIIVADIFILLFFGSLYAQTILGFSALQVGLSFVPFTISFGFISYKFSDAVVYRLGVRRAVGVGMFTAGVGTLLLVIAPLHGSFLLNILPAMLLTGVGTALAFSPMLVAGMSKIEPTQSGVASGLFNTTGNLGGAFCLAVAASLAATYTHSFVGSSTGAKDALLSGYHVAFLLAAILCFASVVIAVTVLHPLGTTAEEVDVVMGVEAAESQ